VSDPTDFLYPMVDRAGAVASREQIDALMDDLTSSARQKIDHSATTTQESMETYAPVLDELADELAARLSQGGRIFTCGNGGSATDAEGVAALFRQPPTGRALPAVSLVSDIAIVTALANDIGFDAVFARQVLAHGEEHDVLLAFSTSGNSANVIEAFAAARSRGMMTIGFAGDQGGAMAASEHVQHCLVVRTSSIHRIQEAQSALAHDLWRRTQGALPPPGTVATEGSAP
jgi:D-sedoheptulose 7-phosphate isomerase